MAEQKIVTLVDASVYAESVCDHASWAAQRLEAPVELLHVIGRRQTGRQDVSGALALGARTRMLEELTKLEGDMARLGQQHGRALLDAAADRIADKGQSRPSTRLRIGDLIEETNEALEDASLLVIGKRGEAADFARMHLGSNLERMVRSSQRPILVASRAFKPIKRILIAYDGRASARKAVQAVATNPLLKDLDVTLLLVGEPSTDNKALLLEPQRVLEAASVSVSTELVAGQPVDVIAERADGGAFDMLVMGAFGGGLLRSMIIGSTTTEMLISCRVPVLLFR